MLDVDFDEDVAEFGYGIPAATGPFSSSLRALVARLQFPAETRLESVPVEEDEVDVPPTRAGGLPHLRPPCGNEPALKKTSASTPRCPSL